MAGLFKKKKKKKTTEPEIAELPEEMPGAVVSENDIQNILGDVLKDSGVEEITTKLDDLSRKIDELQAKIERHDSMIGSLQNEVNEIRKVNEEVQDNIKRLLDIYEVVSQRINPFIEMGERQELPPVAPETMIPAEETPVFPEEKPETIFQEVPKKAPEPRPAARGEEKREVPEMPRLAEGPILKTIKRDYYTIVLLMRWIEFLFERVKRDKITLLLDYYVDIGWISREVKSEIMAYARGEVQDVTKYFPEEEIEAEIETPAGTIKAPKPRIYMKVEDWRLSAEDHLKSLLFIMKIAGIEVNKDKLNSLEQEIEKFKKSLWEYHGV